MMKILSLVGYVLVGALLACQVGEEEPAGEDKFTRKKTETHNDKAYKVRQMDFCIERLKSKLAGENFTHYGSDKGQIGLQSYISRVGIRMNRVVDGLQNRAPADVYDYSVVDMGSAGLLFLIIGYPIFRTIFARHTGIAGLLS